MREYETVFILDPKLDEGEVKDEIGKVQSLITSLDGEVVGVEPAGKRKLTYEIKGNREGYYTLITFRSKPASIGELERAYKLNEKVLRHIIVHSVQKEAGASEEEHREDA
jgi:small subunit ribosomal protein S6